MKTVAKCLLNAKAEVTAEILDKVAASDVKVIDTIYTNELDCGPYISDTLRIDGTRSRLEALVEIYHDATWGAAYEGSGGESV